jgi:hypothetical protein
LIFWDSRSMVLCLRVLIFFVQYRGGIDIKKASPEGPAFVKDLKDLDYCTIVLSCWTIGVVIESEVTSTTTRASPGRFALESTRYLSV